MSGDTSIRNPRAGGYPPTPRSGSSTGPAAGSVADRVDRGPSTAERASKVRFRRALALMLMTLLLPGSAQILAGNRRVGHWALRIAAVLCAGGVGLLLIGLWWHELFFWLGTTPWVLTWLRIGLIALGVGWAALFVDAWRLGNPLSLRLGQRRWAVAANGVLAFSVAAVLLFGAHLVGVHRGLILSTFTGTTTSSAVDGRYNILLVGADSGTSRWGLRTDSMTVASIDAETGRTVLIGLPRNMENFPFQKGSIMAKQFPHGYNCSTCELNSLATYAADHKSLFAKFAQPGVEATIEGIEGITDLKINYWAMVNLQGFREIADAVGGVTINVRQAIPIGGLGDDVTGYIKPGVQKLSGDKLLWYARSRDSSDDYSRMARQKCVMNAFLQQVSPTDVVKHYEALANATEAMVKTSIPPSEVDTFVNLALKARGQKVSTLSLVPPLVDTGDPDIKVIRAAVKKAIAKAEGTAAKPKGKVKKKSTSVMTGGSLGSLSTGYAANQTSDLSTAC
ncbi:MAG: LCP family protein [Nocardioides sp.]|uniref:LCP family protein n=1 Tax=Nocardioides sp. TaxID=35761 RepID=UPI0039E44113